MRKGSAPTAEAARSLCAACIMPIYTVILTIMVFDSREKNCGIVRKMREWEECQREQKVRK